MPRVDPDKAIQALSALREAQGHSEVDLVPPAQEGEMDLEITHSGKFVKIKSALAKETFKKLGKSPSEVCATGMLEILRNPNHKHYKSVLQIALDRMEGPVTQALALSMELPPRTIIKGDREVIDPPALPGSEEA